MADAPKGVNASACLEGKAAFLSGDVDSVRESRHMVSTT
jgi:hypothetical protein